MQSLDLIPTDIHERSPIFLGSSDNVEEIKARYAEEAKKAVARKACKSMATHGPC